MSKNEMERQGSYSGAVCEGFAKSERVRERESVCVREREKVFVLIVFGIKRLNVSRSQQCDG